VIALATALKMYPSLLLVYLLLRHRRAFVSAVVTLLVVVVLIGTLTGWATFAEYAATTRGVVAEYERFRTTSPCWDWRRVPSERRERLVGRRARSSTAWRWRRSPRQRGPADLVHRTGKRESLSTLSSLCSSR